MAFSLLLQMVLAGLENVHSMEEYSYSLDWPLFKKKADTLALALLVSGAAPPTLSPPTAPAAAAQDGATIPYGEKEIAEQRQAVAWQNEHLQQQMLDAGKAMQVVLARTAATQQSP